MRTAILFFLNETAPPEITPRSLGAGVGCVKETGLAVPAPTGTSGRRQPEVLGDDGVGIRRAETVRAPSLLPISAPTRPD